MVAPLTYSLRLLIAAIISIVIPLMSNGQQAGCTDVAANNYNALATVNDGSCSYDIINNTPIIKVDSLPDILKETSALQWASGSLWTLNDGGGAAAIYRIDTITGNILQTVNLQGATNVDWEDMSFDGTYFYIGDFGNNLNGGRTDLKVYKFPIDAIPPYNLQPVDTVPAEKIAVISFTYADQTQPPVPSLPNNTRFDCEAMIVDSKAIHLFTKNWVDNNTTHYIINGLTAGNYQAQPLETYNTGYLVTAADKLPGQDTIILLGYQVTGFGMHFIHRLSGYHGGLYFNGNKRRIDLPSAAVMGQAEGITFKDEGYAYISNEKFTKSLGLFTVNVNAKLRSIYLPATYEFNGAGDWKDASNWTKSRVPTMPINGVSEVIINPTGDSQCIFNGNMIVDPGGKVKLLAGKKLILKSD